MVVTTKSFYVSSRQPLPKWLTYCLLHLIWLILSTSKTGLQAAVTVLHKPGICCVALSCHFNESILVVSAEI